MTEWIKKLRPHFTEEEEKKEREREHETQICRIFSALWWEYTQQSSTLLTFDNPLAFERSHCIHTHTKEFQLISLLLFELFSHRFCYCCSCFSFIPPHGIVYRCSAFWTYYNRNILHAFFDFIAWNRSYILIAIEIIIVPFSIIFSCNLIVFYIHEYLIISVVLNVCRTMQPFPIIFRMLS